MTVLSLLEFDDESEHTFDDTKLELVNDQGRIKSQINPDEICFFNFENDDDLNSKRGDVALVLSGFSGENTGRVVDGELNLGQDDKSQANLTNIPKKVGSDGKNLGFRFKLKIPFETVAGYKYIMELTNNENAAYIQLYLNSAGDSTTITMSMKNDAGGTVAAAILASFDFNIGDIVEIGFSRQSSGTYRFYINGSPVNSNIAADFTFETVNFKFGSNANDTFFSYDDFQLFNGDNFVDLDLGAISLEPTDLPVSENTMLTDIPFLLDEMILFDTTEQIPLNSSLKHYFVINLNRTWFNTVSKIWEISNGLLAQSNTKKELNDNLASLPLVRGIGAFFQVAHVFKSNDGYATALLENMTLGFTFKFKTSDFYTCLIYGTITDGAGNPIEGVAIEFKCANKFTGGVFVGPKAIVKSNAQGKYSISIIETETNKTTVDILIDYGGENGKFEFKNRVIPKIQTVELSKLKLPVV